MFYFKELALYHRCVFASCCAMIQSSHIGIGTELQEGTINTLRGEGHLG